MLEETRLGLGRYSDGCKQSLGGSGALVVSQSRGEQTSTPDGLWQRSKLFAVPAHAPMPIGHPTFSAGEPSLPLSLGSSHVSSKSTPSANRGQAATTPKPEEEWGKSLALSVTPVSGSSPRPAPSPPSLNYQERFVLLQAYLKHCDEVGVSQSVQELKNLSPAARSGVAVELESKAMWLAIEEGLEMRRVSSINVMGWNGPLPTGEDDGATPRGRRLPVPSEIRPSPSFMLQPWAHPGLLSVGQTPSPYS